MELTQYLKTEEEFKAQLPIIKCNAITVQHDGTTECGSLCIYVIYHLTRHRQFSDIIQELQMRYMSEPSPRLKLKIR